MQQLWIIFITIFLAELGDKSQLATVLFASKNPSSPLLVFCAAALALIASMALAVGFGTLAQKYIDFLPLKLIAGAGFVLIGIWTIYDHYHSA